MMAVERASHEWPSVLRDAPIPGTISTLAATALRNAIAQPAEGELSAQRELCARVQRELGQRQMARYRVTERTDEIAGVPVRIFSQADADRNEQVLLNLHGGGFTKDAGSVTENVPIAGLTGATVVAVRYRLAPEFPFPAAVDDAERVYRALLETVPAAKIGLYGTSAGAILCAQLLVRLKQTGCPMPAALGFFTGTADLSRPGDTEHFYRPVQDAARAGELFAPYVGSADTRTPEVSPIFDDLAPFPPTLCIAGTRDFLLSQTAIFHRSLLAAGVEAELVVFEAMLHAHWIYLDIPESDEAFGIMARFFRKRLA